MKNKKDKELKKLIKSFLIDDKEDDEEETPTSDSRVLDYLIEDQKQKNSTLLNNHLNDKIEIETPNQKDNLKGV